MKCLYIFFSALLVCSAALAQEKAVLFEDDFHDMKGTNGNAGNWNFDIKASVVNAYGIWFTLFDTREANGCIQIGKGGSASSVYTNISNYMGDAIISFRAAPAIYSSGNNQYSPSSICVNLTQGSVFSDGYSTHDFAIQQNAWTSYTYKITFNSKEAKVCFTSTDKYGNFFLDDVKITKCYRRTGLAEDNFGTICMPFAVKHEDLTGATMYNIAYKITDGEKVTGIILSEETGDLVAGKPYIFKATATELFAIYNGVSVPEAVPATGLVGNLSTVPVNVPEQSQQSRQSYILSGNHLRKVTTGTATVGQNRAYINLEFVPEYTSPASLSKEYIYFDLNEGEMDLEDGISAVKGKTTSASAYDLMGRKVAASGTKKGLIIKGGRKLVNVK